MADRWHGVSGRGLDPGSWIPVAALADDERGNGTPAHRVSPAPPRPGRDRRPPGGHRVGLLRVGLREAVSRENEAACFVGHLNVERDQKVSSRERRF